VLSEVFISVQPKPNQPNQPNQPWQLDLVTPTLPSGITLPSWIG